VSALRHDPLTLAEAARIMREATEDKSYQQTPLGQEAAAYLRIKRKRLTESSHRDYERGLAHFCWHFADLELVDFESPHGTDRLEAFLDHEYGHTSPRNYNKNLSILGSFFEFLVIRKRMLTDPTTPIERARTGDVHRTTFTTDQQRAIIASAEDLRDRIALRLLLHYGIRKGALKVIQFKHFDHQRKRLTIFTKGRKVRDLPIPHPAFWMDLERHLIDAEAQPSHYLMCRQRTIPRAGVRRFPDKPMADHGLHDWWYRQLENAGIVATGTTSGERMHKARHTAGQRILDHTGNLKAVQKLLGHSSISTTADVYTDWDIDQLTTTLTDVLKDDPE
jgi:site-specific recombinase XerC